MKNNNLLASVALFGELYKSDSYSNINDILAEFIKGAISFDDKYSFNSTEVKELLYRVYGFTIPESVIRTILKNRLKDCVTKEFNIYHFDKSKLTDIHETKNEIDRIEEKQDKIINEFCNYVSSKRNINNDSTLKEKVQSNLSNFLMDNGYLDEYSDLISAYIIANENNDSFTDTLNSIKEGLVLYQGLTYSDDISQLGSWKDEMTIYLSTEHLFNMMGYNGTMFKEIFDDFISLVKEINTSSKKSLGKEIIRLRYFEETKKEVESFFLSAESIKNGVKRLDPTKIAMSSILQGCSDVNCIKLKQVNFFIDLKRKGVEFQDYSFETINNKYNVVDEKIIEQLKKASEDKNKYFDEEYCIQCMRIFTKVNSFRKGVNNIPFEKIKHIYLTENNFAKFLAHNNKVKFEDTDISFAKDIDYVITKFWFKLKKGFKDKTVLPKTFNVITKAKIIIASHLNNSLYKSYDQLQKDFKAGKLTQEQAIELNKVYKEKPLTPEHVNKGNIDDSLDFMNDENFVEDFLREKTKKEIEYQESISENEELKKELEQYKLKEAESKRNAQYIEIKKNANEFAISQYKKYSKSQFLSMAYAILVFILTILPVAIGLFLKLYKPISTWIETIGNWQILIWITLVVVFGIEIIGRSYLFDKTKVSRGWIWLKTIIAFKLKSYKKTYIDETAEKYINEKTCS